MIFYIKEGEDFKEATDDQVLSRFKERIDRIKSSTAKEVEVELDKKIRSELTPKLTEDLTKSLTTSIKEQLEGDYKTKLDEAEKKANDSEIKVRQKTITAEYGFKSDMESFLGSGTEEEMRANADKLKDNIGVVKPKPPEKETGAGAGTSGFVSKVS